MAAHSARNNFAASALLTTVSASKCSANSDPQSAPWFACFAWGLGRILAEYFSLRNHNSSAAEAFIHGSLTICKRINITLPLACQRYWEGD